MQACSPCKMATGCEPVIAPRRRSKVTHTTPRFVYTYPFLINPMVLIFQKTWEVLNSPWKHCWHIHSKWWWPSLSLFLFLSSVCIVVINRAWWRWFWRENCWWWCFIMLSPWLHGDVQSRISPSLLLSYFYAPITDFITMNVLVLF